MGKSKPHILHAENMPTNIQKIGTQTHKHTHIHKNQKHRYNQKSTPSLLASVFLRRVVDRSHTRFVANNARCDLCVNAQIQCDVGGFAMGFLGLDGSVDLFGVMSDERDEKERDG
jgi:hypothetical protein